MKLQQVCSATTLQAEWVREAKKILQNELTDCSVSVG